MPGSVRENVSGQLAVVSWEEDGVPRLLRENVSGPLAVVSWDKDGVPGLLRTGLPGSGWRGKSRPGTSAGDAGRHVGHEEGSSRLALAFDEGQLSYGNSLGPEPGDGLGLIHPQSQKEFGLGLFEQKVVGVQFGDFEAAILVEVDMRDTEVGCRGRVFNSRIRFEFLYEF